MAVAKGLYHFPCPDGITAALACYLGLKQKGIPLQLIPHTTYTPIDIETIGITVRINAGCVSFHFAFVVTFKKKFAIAHAEQRHCLLARLFWTPWVC